MYKRWVFTLLGAVLLLARPVSSLRQESQEIALRIFPEFVHFPSADPDLEPIIYSENPIQVEIEISRDIRWNVTVLADGDLEGDQGDIIAIENITWTASPSPPFINGSMSKLRPQLLASGYGGSDFRGEILFMFRNSWNYTAGEYSQTLSITATAL